MTKTDERTPPLTWTELESLLLTLADTPAKRGMVRHLVQGVRKQSPFLTPEGTFKEILFIGAAMLDVRFQPPVSVMTPPSAASSRSSPSPQPRPWP